MPGIQRKVTEHMKSQVDMDMYLSRKAEGNEKMI